MELGDMFEYKSLKTSFVQPCVKDCAQRSYFWCLGLSSYNLGPGISSIG